MVVDVDPSKELNLIEERLLHSGGDGIAFRHLEVPVHADGQIEHQVWPEVVKSEIVDMVDAGDSQYALAHELDELWIRPGA